MSLINDIRKKVNSEFEKTLKAQTVSDKKEQFGSVSFAVSAVPRIVEKKNTEWVEYGEGNLYPQQLDELSKKSAIHGAIIKTASDMISGNGFLINGAKTKEESEAILKSNPNEAKEYQAFLDNKFDSMSIEKIKNHLAIDLKKHGAYCFEVVWNKDFTKIARIKYISVKNIRAGKLQDGKVKSFWYSRDWANIKKTEFTPKELFAFDKTDKKNYNQIVYEKLGVEDYYGEPDYMQGIDWINIDYQLGIFHLSNIENGMNPSLLWEFFKEPAGENAKQDVMDDIRRNYKGASKAGRHIVLFNNGSENAAKVGPIQVNNLDKQLLNLAELSDKKILTAHELTSPLLAGISVSGQIGGNIELEKAYNVYDKTRIAPYRLMLSASFQQVLDVNGIPFKIQINPFDPFTQDSVKGSGSLLTDAINSLSPLVANKVLESMTADEIRQFIGLGAATQPLKPPTPEQ